MFDSLMRKFKPLKGYRVEDYLSVSTLSYSTKEGFSIRLCYEYVKNAKYGSTLIVKDFEQHITAQRILEEFRQKNHEPVEDLFDDSTGNIAHKIDQWGNPITGD